MVVSIDKGEKKRCTPIYKKPIGERLASCALHLQYDKKVPYSGPVYKSMQIKDNKAEISFDFVYSGLTALGEELKGFSICGADYNFVSARAEIRDGKVFVWSDVVERLLRYVMVGLIGRKLIFLIKEGFPATPFPYR